MAGLFGLSVDPKAYQGEFSEDFFWGTLYQQHLGEEYAGIALSKNGNIEIQSYPGLFNSNFYNKMVTLEGTEAIGYCGSQEEPFRQKSKLGEIAACFSGNITNCSRLMEEFFNFGHTLERGDEIEVIVKFIAQGRDTVDGIARMSKKVEGSYALLVLGAEGMYAATFSGHWPLVIGEKKGALAIATDPSGFDNIGFEILRDLAPGEIVLIKNGKLETKTIITPTRSKICSFLWVYTAFPTGVFRGIPVSLIRRRLGAALAARDIKNGFIPDIVTLVPDSGRHHGIGYFEEFCRQMNEGRIKRIPIFDELLSKYPYAGRSFTPQDEKKRKKTAHFKLLKSSEKKRYQGKVVVVCDDSIVRGNQTQTNLVPKYKALGVSEIHLRISNPELHSYCPYGKTTKKGELFSERFQTKEEKIEFLGVQGLEYNTIDDLVRVIGLPREVLCVDCNLLQS